MKTSEIQKEIGKTQVLKFHSPVCENVNNLLNHEMDVMSISKSGMMYEFEVKISRSDFKADFKKRKQLYFKDIKSNKERLPNYFSYVCLEGLINKNEIPDWSGLYYLKEGLVVEILKPKCLHKFKHDRVKVLEKISRINTERNFLGCCRLTYENKIIKERNSFILNA